jgi:hypothetical protein
MEDKKELIVVKQLPIIEQTLKAIGEKADIKIKKALEMEIKGESLDKIQEAKVEVKKVRTELKKEFDDLESKRKSVKSEVLKPYEDMEAIYKKEVTDRYVPADKELKEKIDAVENSEKEQITKEVKEYFDEYLESNNVDFITYDNAKINVTLSASMKSLKEDAKAFIDKVVDDLKLIDTQENKIEILAEYKESLNVSQAITNVNDRHKRIEAEKQRQEELKAKTEAESVVIAKVEEVIQTQKIVMPTIQNVISKKVILEVDVNKEQFENLTKYLKEEGIVYEWKK